MKIVDVCGFYSETGGGVRSYVRQKFDAAHRAGHDLTVIAPGTGDMVEARRGGRILWLAGPAMPFDANYRLFGDRAAVWRALDVLAPDIIEGSSPWGSGRMAGFWPGRAARALIFHQDFVAGYPYTVLDRWLSGPKIDALFSPYWRRVRRLSERFDVTVAGGGWLARRLAGFGVANAVAVPFGVEPGPFSPARRDAGRRNDLLARCGVAPSGRLLLAVGRFHPEKRHRTIIEAFVQARKTRPDLGLVLAGDGLTRKTVERLARRVGGVHLLGAVSDRAELASLYASADAPVHGSGAETYGLVVAEAMASGLPVIVPDTGGAADLAARGPSRTYATGDARACAAAIVDLLATSSPVGSREVFAPAGSDAHFGSLFALYAQLIVEKSKILA